MRSDFQTFIVTLLLLCSSLPGYATEQNSSGGSKLATKSNNQKIISSAKAIFKDYKTAYQSYNFSDCDKHYSPSLKVYMTLKGKTRVVDGNKWRKLSGKTLTQMKTMGIKSSFGEAQYSAKGKYARVRFKVKTLHEVDTIDWLLKEDSKGQLKIVEERQKATITQ